MRQLGILFALGLAVALALVAFAGNAAAQATLPNLQVGKAVGYGLNLDLTSYVAPLLTSIRQNASMFNITHITALDFTGSFDTWVYEKVIDKTATYYTFQTQAASGIKIHFAFNATFNNLPQEGTHSGSYPYGYCSFVNVPTETGTVEADADLTVLVTSDGKSWYTTAEYAIHNATSREKVQLNGAVKARHVPMVTANYTSCQETVTYENRDLSISVNMDNQVREAFSPNLDYFNFPINDGEDWYANSTMTVGATLSGTIDVGGLSAEEEAQFFENLTLAFQSVPGLAVSGLDHFPIDLAEIQITENAVPILVDGVLHDQTQDVSLHLQAEEKQMSLADGDIHTVYLISLYNPSTYCQPNLAAVYSPDDGMIVGYQLTYCLYDTPVPIAELRNVPPDQAQSKLQETEKTYAAVPSTPSNPLTDLFLTAPYYGWIIVVVAAVLVVSYLIVRRRRKPAMVLPPAAVPPSPPATPPQTPPPMPPQNP